VSRGALLKPQRSRFLALVLILAASLYAFARLAEDYVSRESIVGVDHRLAVWVHRHVSDLTVEVFRVLTYAGGVAVLGAATIAGALLLAHRRRPDLAVFLVSSFVGSELLVNSLKAAFHRARPAFAAVTAHSYSFPSGHAAVSTAVYGASALILAESVKSRLVRIGVATVAVALVGMIGLSRILLDVHYLSDVLAGFSLGLAWLSSCTLGLLAYRASSRGRLVRLRSAPRRS
jgi:membrane-associated phospholipid phosphatase